MENKFKCEYPGCKKESLYRHALELVNEENASVELPYCKYHYYIVAGGHFKAKINKETKDLSGEIKEKSFELLGPFKEVEIAEQVFASIEMIKNDKGKTKKGIC